MNFICFIPIFIVKKVNLSKSSMNWGLSYRRSSTKRLVALLFHMITNANRNPFVTCYQIFDIWHLFRAGMIIHLSAKGIAFPSHFMHDKGWQCTRHFNSQWIKTYLNFYNDQIFRECTIGDCTFAVTAHWKWLPWKSPHKHVFRIMKRLKASQN